QECVPSTERIHRPYMGMASASSASSIPTRSSAWMPRVERARLMLRPPTSFSRRRSGRRSYISMSKPRRANVSASSEPTGPAPTITRGSRMAHQQLPEEHDDLLDVGPPGVEGNGGETDDVGVAQVYHRAAGVKAFSDRAGVPGNAQGEHGAAPVRLPGGELLDRTFRQAVHEPLEVGGQTARPRGQCCHAHPIEELHRGTQR